MRLGNVLSQVGGVVETGRPVRFQLRFRAKDGSVTRKWCDAIILPLGEDERATALAAARAYCVDHPEASANSEEILHLAARFLCNPERPIEKWALASELPLMRSGLIADQLLWLAGQYQIHITEEYPELSPPATAADLRQRIEALRKQLLELESEALGESGPAPA